MKLNSCVEIPNPSALCLMLAAVGCGLPAWSEDAATPGYHIEIIVFRANSAQGGGENWSSEDGSGNTVGDEASSSSSQVGHFISALTSELSFQLSDLESKLRSSGAYVPVAHVAWSQTASAWGTKAGFPVQKLGVDVPGLNGTVYLERGQYLHLGMALSYAIASPPAGLGAGPGTAFTLNENRRVQLLRAQLLRSPGVRCDRAGDPSARRTGPRGR